MANHLKNLARPATETSRAGDSSPPLSRILIIEDHPLMREGIAMWINQDPRMEVCGQFGIAAEGMGGVTQLKPDLVLCDITLNKGNGLELLKDINAYYPELPVIMLSMHDESIYALRAMRAGARGYVMKRAGGAEVVSAICRVLSGEHAFSMKVTNQIMAELSGLNRGRQSPVAALTDREFEIFQLYGKGNSSGEIARILNLSPKTVGTHRINICRKLELKSTSELICLGVHYGDAAMS
ncbi:MAG: DNA-binding NarL/FixJ family response regulator [Lentimonas sp.]|jgi:DNA-binding NarL/FixJ family response regulator